MHRVYANRTTDSSRAAATVRVGENGTYQVSTFAIREGTGILGSSVEHTELVVVGVVPTTKVRSVVHFKTKLICT